jgi:signal transduction histidine kinase
MAPTRDGGSAVTGRHPTPSDVVPRSAPGVFRSRLRDARIRSKLGLILVIPLIAVVALAGVRLVDSGQRTVAAELVRSLAALSSDVATVAHDLHHERMAAARLLAGAGEPDAYNAQAQRTDRAVAAYRAARADLGGLPELVRDRLARVDDQLSTIAAIRHEVLSGTDITLSGAVLLYGVIVADLIAYQESVGQIAGDNRLAESLRAMAALSKAKSQMSEAQAIGYVALQDDNLDPEQLTSFLGALTGQQEALLAFGLAASTEQQEIVSATITGGAVSLADRAASDVVRSAGGAPVISADGAEWALGSVVDLVRFAELGLHADLQVFATELRDSVLTRVLVESVAVLLALIIAITIAVLLARALATSLGQLREGALAVANRDLPQTVARLSDPRYLGENTPEQAAARIRAPIRLRSRDEIGQVAQAFNAVHREAVRVAAEQAALRTGVSVMFLNLARRSQALVDQIIGHLDDIERNEEDPKRLARLFVLDHLATRMRRNDENLLVLAGADSSAPRTDDALVVDVLRAAQSEVEHYNRIEFGTVDTDVAISAEAVNDVVRLTAELFDNATRFSPPNTSVVAEARRVGDHMVVQIEDRGVGMSPEQVNHLNARLAAPPLADITAFRMMGLAVVGRLAARYQIRVELRCDPGFGTVAYVTLPRSILILPRPRLRTAEIPVQRPPMTAGASEPVLTHHIGQFPRRPTTVGQAANAVLPPVPATVAFNPQHVQDTTELPIFREMEAVWFRSHGRLDMGPPAGAEVSHQPPPPPASFPPPPPAPPRRQPPPPPPPPAPPPAPAPRTGTGDWPAQPVVAPPEAAPQPAPAGAGSAWQTAADVGWRAASAAASAATRAPATRSGLPKRVPQAQLVPGGVETADPAAPVRRSPEEVRGLLSAYHRGVQRGRTGGEQ